MCRGPKWQLLCCKAKLTATSKSCGNHGTLAQPPQTLAVKCQLHAFKNMFMDWNKILCTFSYVTFNLIFTFVSQSALPVHENDWDINPLVRETCASSWPPRGHQPVALTL